MEQLQSRSDKKWEGYKGEGLKPIEILPGGPSVDDVMNKVINTKFNTEDAFNRSGYDEFMKQWNEQNKKDT